MQIPLEKLVSGMCLDSDAQDALGRILLPKGTLVTDSHIRGLQMWGVRTVSITAEAEDGSHGEQTSPKRRIQRSWLLTDLERRFSKTDRTHPMMQRLYQECLAFCQNSEGA